MHQNNKQSGALARVEAIIREAISSAYTDYPEKSDGTSWDSQTVSLESSEHFAKAIMMKLTANGYEIVLKKE